MGGPSYVLKFGSLLASYADLCSSATATALTRYRSSATIYKQTPDLFPMSHPFALIAELPPPSLLQRHQQADIDGLSDSATFNCGLAESAVVIFTLILSAPRANLSRFLAEILEIEGSEACSTILKSLFDFCKSVIRFDAFPRQWLTLSLMCFSAIIRSMDPAAELLEKEVFIPPVRDADSFDVHLWMKCFELLCDLCGSEELALEDQTQQRRRAEWIVAGDLRDDGAALLLRLWNAIGWPVTEGKQNGHMSDLRYGGVSSIRDCIQG